MIYYFTPQLGGPGTLAANWPYAFEGAPHATQIDRDSGPDGLAGTVLYSDPVVQLPRIEWRRCDGGWFGWSPALRPGPVSLGRRSVLRLYWPQVTLCDGMAWSVPIAVPCIERDPTRESQLPALAGKGDDGQIVWVPRPESEALAARVRAVLDGPPLDVDAVVRLAADLLAVGYRVSLDEVLALGLLDRTTAVAVIQAAIDWHERVASVELVDKDVAAGVDHVARAAQVDRGTAGRMVAAL